VPGGDASPCWQRRPGLFRSELVVSEELVSQLPDPFKQPVYRHLAVPRLDDLEQHPLPGGLQLNRASGADGLEREHDREAGIVLPEPS
jgi:hypothetical protein